ncbi:hypothetical protein D3C77_211200 [compost metagenome]
MPAIEQRDNLAGTTGGQLLTVNRRRDRFVAVQVPQTQGGERLSVDLKLLAATFGLDLDKGHRVVIILAEQESATPLLTQFGLHEHMIDCADHGLAGTVVGVQAVQASGGGTTGAQVSKDIGAAERIDRLFGVTDHEQAGVLNILLNAVDTLKDPVLDRVGVLEFIDQGDRELLTDQTCQTLASIAVQGVIEAQEHVVKTHFRTTALFLFKTCAHPGGGVFQQAGIGCRQGFQLILQTFHHLQCRVARGFTFPGFSHTGTGQAGEAGTQVKLQRQFICCPGGQLLAPGFEVTGLHLAAVHLLGSQAVTADLQQFTGPLDPGRLDRAQLLGALMQHCIDQRLRLLGAVLDMLPSKQGAHPRQQGIRADPVTTHPGQGIAVHAVAKAPPVVAHDLAKQFAMVGFQGLGKQAATVERMFAQHALTPAVNGRDSRLVHPLRSDVQAIGAR